MSASDTALKAPNLSVAAANGVTFGLTRIDQLGFSIGGMIAQVEQFAELVHRFLGGPGEDWAA